MPEEGRTLIDRYKLSSLLSSLVGREPDLEQVTRLVRERQLVTLTGAPGCGKTRLAAELALRSLDQFTDGVWMVDLVAAQDVQQLHTSLIMALAIHQARAGTVAQSIADFLCTRHLLLVLDNCEHLIAPLVDLLVDLFQNCRRLHVLATSRQRLNYPGEVCWRVSPLATAPLSISGSDVLRYDAAQLWLDRALDLQPDLETTQRDLEAVSEITRRLDGIPLAIELAAGWSNVYSSREILERLRRGDELTNRTAAAADRHRSLHAAIEWSYSLLTAEERNVFTKFGVFAGPASMNAIAHVCTMPPQEIQEIVGRLIDKSLVVPKRLRHDHTAYDMLLTVRHFALSQVEMTDLTRIRRAFVEHYLTLAEQTAPVIGFARGEDRVKMLDLEYSNLDRALEIAASEHGDTNEVAPALAAALAAYWEYRGQLDLALRWLEAVTRNSGMDSSARAWCLSSLATLTVHRDPTVRRSSERSDAAIEMATRLQDRATLARCLAGGAFISAYAGDLDGAAVTADMALRLADDIGRPELKALCLYRWSFVRMHRSELQAATAGYQHCADVASEIGFTLAWALALIALGQLALVRGDIEQAYTYLMTSLQGNQVLNTRQLVVLLEALVACAPTSRREWAATLLGAADRLRAENSVVLRPAAALGYIEQLHSLRASPGSRKALAAGAEMDREAAVRYALELPSSSVARPSRYFLTKRELEIAGLVADGLSNRRIAVRLGLSVRTVDAHMEHIRNKLGVNTRIQIVRWLIESQ